MPGVTRRNGCGTSRIGCPFEVCEWVGVGVGVGVRPTLVPGALVNTCAVFHNVKTLVKAPRYRTSGRFEDVGGTYEACG